MNIESGLTEKEELLEDAGYAIMHGPTGCVATCNFETNYMDSWGHYENSPRIEDDNDELFTVLDMWVEDIRLFKTVEEAERAIEELLNNEDEDFHYEDTREDFSIFKMKYATIRALAVGSVVE